MSTVKTTALKRDNKLALKKAAAYIIFSSVIFYLFIPNIFAAITFSEIFAFISLTPTPMISKNKMINNSVVYGVGFAALIFALIFSGPNIKLIFPLIALLIGAVTVKEDRNALQWIGEIILPFIIFLTIKGSSGNMISFLKGFPYIPENFSNGTDMFSTAIASAAVIFIIYGFTNIFLLMTKEKQVGYVFAGAVTTIVGFLNFFCNLVLGSGLKLSSFKPLIKAIPSLDVKSLLTANNLLGESFLCTLGLPIVFFALNNILMRGKSFIPKKEKTYRISCVIVPIIIGIILIRLQITPTEDAPVLKIIFDKISAVLFTSIF